LGEWYGEDGPVSVDDVLADDEGYLESGLLHGDFLHLVDVLQLPHVEEGPHCSLSDLLDDFGGERLIAVGDLLQLAHLFLEGHDGQKLLDGCLYVLLCLDAADHLLELDPVEAFVFEALDLVPRDGVSHG